MPGAPVNLLVGGGISSSAPMSQFPQTASVPTGSSVSVGAGGQVGAVDGTPMRVATLVALAIFGLAGLKWAGFKFNVTVG